MVVKDLFDFLNPDLEKREFLVNSFISSVFDKIMAVFFLK